MFGACYARSYSTEPEDPVAAAAAAAAAAGIGGFLARMFGGAAAAPVVVASVPLRLALTAGPGGRGAAP